MRSVAAVRLVLIALGMVGGTWEVARAEPETVGWDRLETQFRDLPMEAKRLTGPLFWLHGDESRDQLEEMLERVVESGNGCFTAESRPHRDWLGPDWYRDLSICLEKAKALDLKMWIFDERWWPSQMVGGQVPPEYGSKTLVAEVLDIEGPRTVSVSDCAGPRVIGVVAGRDTEDGVDGSSLLDLTGSVTNGVLSWSAPVGTWKVMIFRWEFTGPKGMQKKWIAVDGASPDCVEWFLRTVYQPHYDRFKDDFGKTIPGFFYDEPETLGDWGSDLMTLLGERRVDWKKVFVAWKVGLAGEEQTAARYQYADALAEAWGRTMYGGMSTWCRERNVVSMGHFMEHNDCLFDPRLSAGNLFQLQKYSDMGGIDLVCRQFYPGQKIPGLWQMAKLGSSISHVYNKQDDIAMCEIFGAYGQDITYPQMKWLTDQMQVRGINYIVPHSFNPRAPYDRDCPPYFYNGGFEPRYPLHRVYCDYTSRLSLLLSGGRHVAPVAFLFLGQSVHAGRSIRPDVLTDALDDAQLDCDWVPYDAFAEAVITGKELALHRERYRVLIVPAAEVIPYETLAKVQAFYDAGGIVVGYGFLPSKSATIGKSSGDIAAVTEAVWGRDPVPGLAVCRTNPKGGRSYILPAEPTPAAIRRVLTGDAGLSPSLQVLDGEADRWLHVLHRVKDGRDVFLVCNQNHEGQARTYRFRIEAAGYPEIWDPMRNEISAVPFERVGDKTVQLDLTLAPMESLLLVFRPDRRPLPPRWGGDAGPESTSIPVIRDPTPPASVVPSAPEPRTPRLRDGLRLAGCDWAWFPEGNPRQAAPVGSRYFRGRFVIPPGRRVIRAEFLGSCDNAFDLYVNGKPVGSSQQDSEGWRVPTTLSFAEVVVEGSNLFAIAATNGADAPNPAGLIGRYRITFENGAPSVGAVDGTWKAADRAEEGWQTPAFDDSGWPAAKVLGPYGCPPWGLLADGDPAGRPLTASPVTSDPFHGHADLPAHADGSVARAFLAMDEPAPEAGAHVTVNGRFVGGFIGRPCRLEVTQFVKAGRNEVVITPFAPRRVWFDIAPNTRP